MSDIISRSRAESDRIGPGSRVKLHFALFLEDGREIDTTRRGAPAELTIGGGQLLPGFEATLLGLQGGDDGQFELAPEQAFGAHNPDNVQWLVKDKFEDIDLEPGLIVSFDGPGGELPGVVQKVVDQRVCVDFNHPLAGKTVTFDVSILRVQNP